MWTNFHTISNQMLYRSVSNEQISSDFLQQISKESLPPFGVLIWKIVDFREND